MLTMAAQFNLIYIADENSLSQGALKNLEWKTFIHESVWSLHAVHKNGIILQEISKKGLNNG